MGRETLAAIADELAAEAGSIGAMRPKLDTVSYEDRPASLTNTTSGPRPIEARPGSMPELITIGEAPVGRATQAAIEDALTAEVLGTLDNKTSAANARQAPAHADASHWEGESGVSRRKIPRSVPGPAEVFEIATFVVRGEEIFSKVSEASRRQFVEERLMHRLPALSMNEVVRIDVSRGAEEATVIMRVWCKVGKPAPVAPTR